MPILASLGLEGCEFLNPWKNGEFYIARRRPHNPSSVEEREPSLLRGHGWCPYFLGWCRRPNWQTSSFYRDRRNSWRSLGSTWLPYVLFIDCGSTKGVLIFPPQLVCERWFTFWKKGGGGERKRERHLFGYRSWWGPKKLIFHPSFLNFYLFFGGLDSRFWLHVPSWPEESAF